MTKQQTCRHCGAPVLTGLDAPLAALPVTLDPNPVDNLGEALALIQGRHTYAVSTINESGRYRRCFDQRTASWIRTGPATHPIHPEHRCGQPLPPAATTPTTWATGEEF